MSKKTNKIKPFSISSTDEMLLNILLRDAKAPLRTIAQQLGTSSVTVMNRIKRLEKEGIITGYAPKVNYEKLGYNVHVAIDVRIAKGKLIELEEKIAREPHIYAVYDTTGEFDATILGRFPSTRMMDSFLKRIQKFEFVQRTNTKLILNTIKETQVEL